MFDVAVLIERQLNDLDADQLIALHEGLEDEVTYHLLLPVDSSASILIRSMSSFGAEFAPPITSTTFDDLDDKIRSAGDDELQASAQLFRDRNQSVSATLTQDDPIDALVALVDATGSREAIVLTEPHVVREFLRTDWTSRAQRKLKVPTVHLLEHVPFEAQG
jgi:hypothetical protein